MTSVFVAFLLLQVLVGFFALQELGAVNNVSAQIRDRWLQSTRVLGDLNNSTSDVRAAEASRLLTQTAPQRKEIDRELYQLIRAVDQSERDYVGITHDSEELVLYNRFASAWLMYVTALRDVIDVSDRHRQSGAVALYLTRSRRAYDAASNALGVLTSRTVVRAAAVNEVAFTTYLTARVVIVIMLAAAGAVLILAIHYVTRRITNPILSLAACMRRLAANDMGAEVEGVGRNDEIGEMARALEVFRGNAVELFRSREAVLQQATMLEEKLQAEQALSDLQRNFVSMASHEIRTPLTIIDGHAQRLISTALRAPPDKVVERAGRIRAMVSQLTQLMEQLLNASKLYGEQPELYFHAAPVDLVLLTAEVVNLHREITPHAQIVTELPRQLNVTADSRLLHQALSNLLANAIKYSPGGGTISVSLRQRGLIAEIIVQDQGIGIPAKDLPHIFDRHRRASNVGGIVGTGIGLYLVKLISELHGGFVSVQSKEDEGTLFYISLPNVLLPPKGLAGPLGLSG